MRNGLRDMALAIPPVGGSAFHRYGRNPLAT